MPDLSLESPYLANHQRIAGIDEAGRGPLAGPVVAAAVILDPQNLPNGINDSKQLSAQKRSALYESITNNSQIGIAIIEPAIIDEINILQATMRAMREAALALPVTPDHLLIDGNKIPQGLPCSADAIIKGDALSLSIAAASIIAKVTRDRIMEALDKTHPEYGFAKHAGYGTKAHKAALIQYGVTPHHRKTFAPVKALLNA